jgi:hypothetical protein
MGYLETARAILAELEGVEPEREGEGCALSALSPVPNPPPMPWREQLPTWPAAWRGRWGRRANELASSGVPWPLDEARAFAEVLAEIASGAPPPGPPVATPPPVRWECLNPWCRHKAGWWLSSHGVVNCLNCVPPASPDLVVLRGRAADAPAVLIGDSTTPAVPRPSPSTEDPDRCPPS